jgi:hypothetical protein
MNGKKINLKTTFKSISENIFQKNDLENVYKKLFMKTKLKFWEGLKETWGEEKNSIFYYIQK